MRDIAKLGEIISAANAAGANSISGPTFTVDDPAPARAEAIDEAVADARKSAEAMAEAAGKSVGEVLSMSSSDVGLIPGPMYSAAEMAAVAGTCPSSRVSSTSARTWSWSSSSSSQRGWLASVCRGYAEVAAKGDQMCLGCIASSAYWDAAGEDQSLESREELEREKRETMRDLMHAWPTRPEEDRSAGRSPAGSP